MTSNKKSILSSNIFTFFIGTALLIWGIIVIYFRFAKGIDITGTAWLVLVGGIMIISGISNILLYRYNRDKVIGALKSYERINLSQLSSELKLSDKQTKDIIVDLRTEGKLKASFEPETGDVLVFEVNGVPPIAIVPMSSSGLPEHEVKYKDKQIPRDLKYCQYCGSIVNPNDRFCNNCGSDLS